MGKTFRRSRRAKHRGQFTRKPDTWQGGPRAPYQPAGEDRTRIEPPIAQYDHEARLQPPDRIQL